MIDDIFSPQTLGISMPRVKGVRHVDLHDDAGMPVEYQREAFKALLAVESDSME